MLWKFRDRVLESGQAAQESTRPFAYRVKWAAARINVSPAYTLVADLTLRGAKILLWEHVSNYLRVVGKLVPSSRKDVHLLCVADGVFEAHVQQYILSRCLLCNSVHTRLGSAN